MSDRSSQDETEMESKNLNDICKESSRKIALVDVDLCRDRGGSLDRLKQAMKDSKEKREGKESGNNDISKKGVSDKNKGVSAEESTYRDSESTRDESKLRDKDKNDQSKKNRNRTLDRKQDIKEKSVEAVKKGRPITAVEELIKRPSAYNNQKKILQGNTILKVEGAFSKKISIRKDLVKESSAMKKLEQADAYSDDEDSIQTIKKQVSSKTPQKKKLKHKLSVCLPCGGETGLARHFLEAGEWRRVPTPDEAAFTFIINERKLDWDLSLKTMVKKFYQVNKVPGVSFLSRKRELSYILNKYGRLYHGEGGMDYFPETFLLPEQLDDYKRVHKVSSP